MWGRRLKLEKAFEAMEKYTKEYGFEVNVHVLTCLVSACLANNAVDKALEVFHRMKADKAVDNPDERTYSVLIQGCAKQGRFEDAIRLVEEAYGLQPDGTARGGFRDGALATPGAFRLPRSGWAGGSLRDAAGRPAPGREDP